jgi:hypothetical protein
VLHGESERSSLVPIEALQPVATDVYRQYSLEKLKEASKGSGVSLLSFLARFPLEEVQGITTDNAFRQVWDSNKTDSEQCILVAKLFSVTKSAEEASSIFDRLMSKQFVVYSDDARSRDVYPPDKIFEVIALLGWDCRAALDAIKAKTYKQLIKVKENCPPKMKAEAIVDAKIDTYWTKRAKDTQILDEAISVYEKAPEESEGRRISGETADNLISEGLKEQVTTAQIKRFYNSYKGYISWRHGVCDIVFAKWDESSVEDITRAKDFAELKKVREYIRPKATNVWDAFTIRALELVN